MRHVLRFPETPTRVISEALRALPLIDSPYDVPQKMTKHDTKLRLYTVQKGKKLFYSGTPLPAWDGTELEEMSEEK